MPQRYRGRDLIWWLAAMGLDQTPVEARGPDATLPLITGAYGGHTIDFREFVSEGVTLLGRLRSVRDRILQLADDLGESLAYGDAAYRAFLDRVDSSANSRR
jgi:putative flavoprotein involved in K+ transport